MVNDTVGDMLTRIRNSLLRGKFYLEVPCSNLLEDIAKVLLKEGYIEKFEVEETSPQKVLSLHLKKDVIRGLLRVSKPSRRVYANVKKIPRVKQGLGIAILSTSKGVVSDRTARKEKIGGEILAYIW